MGIFLDNRPLLDAFRRGERHAFSAVYQTYVHKVANVLEHGFTFESDGKSLRFHGFADPVELEAFVQEVFVRALSEGARNGYDGLRPFEPYLLRIARNRVIDELRRRRSALEDLIGPLDEEPPAPDGGEADLPEHRLDVARARREVQEFVAGRSDLEQRYIAARFEQDLSQLAAAREVGITRTGARVLERRLLSALRKHLRSSGYLEGFRGLAVYCLGLV